MTRPEVSAKYYMWIDLQIVIEGVNTERLTWLAGMTKYAFYGSSLVVAQY